MSGWGTGYSFRCEIVDYSQSPTALRVSFSWKNLELKLNVKTFWTLSVTLKGNSEWVNDSIIRTYILKEKKTKTYQPERIKVRCVTFCNMKIGAFLFEFLGFKNKFISLSSKTRNRVYMTQQFHFWVHTPSKCKAKTQEAICTPIFLAALFRVARKWRRSKCALANEWLDSVRVYIQ